MDVRQIYQEAQADLARYQAQLATIQQKVAGLTKVVEGLRVLDPDLGNGAQHDDGAGPSISVGGELRHSADGATADSSADHRLSIMSVIRTAETFMSTQEIVDAMILGGFIEDDRETAEAVRKVVSRMASAGQLVRERRDGRSYNYGLPSMAPQNAESPAGTGLSVVPAHDSPEGGEAYGTGDHRDHDSRERDSDHFGGAPSVVEG